MFFWKKKKEEPDNNQSLSVNKSGVGMYKCIGVNYLKVIEVDGEDLDEAKENLFDNIDKRNRVYSKVDIEQISIKILYDAWEAFIWIELPALGHKPQVEIANKYRWLGIKDEFKDTQDFKSKLEETFNHKSFYTKIDIQNFAMKLGFQVFAYCEWQRFSEITKIYPNQTFVYYLKIKS